MAVIVRILIVLLAVSSSSLALAQSIPRSVDAGNLGREVEPPQPKSSPRDLFPSPSQQQAPSSSKSYAFVLQSLTVEGSTVFDRVDLLTISRPHLGKKVGADTLFDIANAITRMYNENGYALTVAYVPAQKIAETGEAKIRVVEGYIDDIVYTGDAQALSKRAKRNLERIKGEKPLTSKTLEAYLLKVKDLPGLNIRTTIDKSKANIGAAKLVVDVDYRSFAVNAGINNRGSESQGPARAEFGFSFYGLLGKDSGFAIRTQSALDNSEFQYLGVNYQKVVSDGGSKLGFMAYQSESEPSLETLEGLDYLSNSEQVSMSFSRPLKRSRGKNVEANMVLDVRHSESELAETIITDEDTRVLRLGLIYDWVNSRGATSLIGASLSQGLGILDGTKSGDANTSREDAEFDFTSIKIDANRLQPLSRRTSLFLSLLAQYSPNSLASSEECGWGGEFMGRAYDDFELSGDSCWLMSAELQINFTPSSNVRLVQPYLYWDGGKLWDDSAGQRDSESLGAGIRILIGDHHSLYAEVAKPIADEVIQEESDDARGFVSWRMNF